MKNKWLSALIALFLAFMCCVELRAEGEKCWSNYGCPAYDEICYHSKDNPYIPGTCVKR